MPTQTSTTLPASTRPPKSDIRHPRRIIVYAALVLIGMLLGTTINAPRQADAEISKGPQRKAFLSGGARSELVLIEIAGVITRIDGRLARIEKAVELAAKQGPRK